MKRKYEELKGNKRRIKTNEKKWKEMAGNDHQKISGHERKSKEMKGKGLENETKCTELKRTVRKWKEIGKKNHSLKTPKSITQTFNFTICLPRSHASLNVCETRKIMNKFSIDCMFTMVPKIMKLAKNLKNVLQTFNSAYNYHGTTRFQFALDPTRGTQTFNFE